VGDATCTGELSNEHKILVGKYQEERPHGTPRYTCEDNIKFEFEEAGPKTYAFQRNSLPFFLCLGDVHSDFLQKNIVRA
jgi:hypothetical protein